MNVKTGITQLGDFLGQELHSLGRVAEDYRLVYLKLNNKMGNTGHKDLLDKQNLSDFRSAEVKRTLEKRVLRQWTFCLSVTYA